MSRVIVIGAGPGGYEAALYAAKKGHDVTLVEKNALGGTCMNVGCIPTKALLAVTDTLHTVESAKRIGVEVPAGSQVDFAGAYARKDKIVKGLSGGVAFLMNANHVRVVEGNGSVEGVGKVRVQKNDGEEEVLEGDEILLATGSVPALPRIFPYDGEVFVSSDEILSLDHQPESVAIVGGGVIGCEIGQYLSRMKTKVTIAEMMPHLLPNEDEDVVKVLAKSFKKDHIDVYCGSGVEKAEKTEDGGLLTLADGTEIRAELVLVAIGRRPNTEGLNLQEAGVEVDERGYVKVDAHMQTSVPHIYAIGDIVRSPQLAHVASYEGFVAVDNLSGDVREADLRAVPRCVYTDPEIGAVGLTETDAQKQGKKIKVGSFPFSALGKAKASGHIDGLAKIIADEKGEILGGAVVGDRASEIVSALTVAIAAHMTAEQLGQVIFAHPSMSESLLEAAHDVYGHSVNKG